MKNKMFKRVLSSLMAAMLVVGLTACGNNAQSDDSQKQTEQKQTEVSSGANETESNEDKAMYPVEGNPTLTLGLVGETVVTAFADNLFETPLGKAWQEATGITIEVEQYNDSDAFNLMVAGGEYPDLLYFNPVGYTGGVDKAVSDGLILPVNDYAEYVPDLLATLNSNETWRKSVTTADGSIIGAASIKGDNYLNVSAGMMIRQDWLDDLGLDVPQTADDLYNVLVAFKEEKGATTPLTATSFWLNFMLSQGIITTPFNLVKTDWYQTDGEIHLGSTEKEYKDVLAYLNKLYSENLLDNNYSANDGTIVLSNMAKGISGVTVGAQGSVLGNILASVEEDNPTFDLTGVGSLVAKKGDTAYSGHSGNAWNGNALVVTTQCKDVENAMKFINYGYTEEGHMLLNFGIEGVSYEMVDGYPTFTELITNNPDGMTMQQALAQYTRSWESGPMVQDRRYLEQYATRPQQKAALKTWSDTDAATYQVPNLTIAEEDLAEYNKLWADISTYISEMQAKYISGQVSLDNFETEYLAQLEKMGIERVKEIMQKALDAFNAK